MESKNYLHLYLKNIELLNRINYYLTIFIGFSGSWWFWMEGIIILEERGVFDLIFIGLISLLLIIMGAYLYNENNSKSMKTLPRIIALISIIGYYYYGGNTLISIFLFGIGIIVQDNLAPIRSRILRTQTFNYTGTLKFEYTETLKSASEYINNRIEWLKYTLFVTIGISILILVFSSLINNLLIKFNPAFFQLISLIMLGLMFYRYFPKLFPPLNVKDNQK